LKYLLQLFLLCIAAVVCAAEPLRVGVAGSPPFVVHEPTLDGLSVRIWSAAADKAGLKYKLTPYPQVAAGLKAVASGEIDILVGPVSITSARAEKVAFTQPYFNSSLGILSHRRAKSLWQRMRPFFTQGFLLGCLSLLVILGFVGSLIWLVERRANPEQFPLGSAGLGNGMWFAVVTMTTVGYGDRCPVTPAGRFLSAVWMILAAVSFSTLTAGIASAMTLANLSEADIHAPEMLAKRSVGVVVNTTSAEAARQLGAHVVPAANLDEAIEMLRRGRVDAVVFDHPILQYTVAQIDDPDLRLAESSFDQQDYGFALPLGSPLTHSLNVGLLRLAEAGEIANIRDRWLVNSQPKG